MAAEIDLGFFMLRDARHSEILVTPGSATVGSPSDDQRDVVAIPGPVDDPNYRNRRGMAALRDEVT